MHVVESYMQGVDPITMLPVRPDPMMACQRAFEIAFQVDPIAQQREQQRQEAARLAFQQQEQQRRRNLAGVGGGSGQAPRSAPDPSQMSQEQRKSEMTEYLRRHMFGESQGE